MKVIFLDVDGVLNCSDTRAMKGTVGIGLDTEKVELLSKIVKETNAEIVLTSTWKIWWEKDKSKQRKDGFYLDDSFSAYGMKILDKTPLGCSQRGEGIHTYLEEHKEVTDWVALDDEVFEDYERFGVLDNLVKTSFYKGGLKEQHVELAIKKLNKT